MDYAGACGGQYRGRHGGASLAEFMRMAMAAKRHGRGFGGPRWGGHGGGYGMPFGGPRTGRGRGYKRRGAGDVRAAVLLLLEKEPMHGYQLIQEISERSDGAWSPSPGSVYPTLQQLEDEGLVVIEKAEGRKVVHLTDAGYAYVEENREKLEAVWNSVEGEVDDRLVELRKLFGQLYEAVASVASEGDDLKSQKAEEVLKEARKDIYRILAEDDTEN